MAAKSQSKNMPMREFQKKLVNSRFFTVSVFLHLILVATFGGTVLFRAYVEPPDFEGGGDGGGFVSSEVSVAPPPQQQQIVQPQFTPNTPTAPSMSAITTAAPVTPTSFSVPTIVNPSITATAKTLSPSSTNIQQPTTMQGLTPDVAAGIKGFTEGWQAQSGGAGGPGTSVKQRKFKFTAYLAKYGGGNWQSTVRLDKGKITGGSLPNLLYVIRKLSNDRIDATPQAEPLDLSKREDIIAKKPPFIFFTGHRDFTLTDQEVANLQYYIRLGGCIWGDSSVPGQRSRFDIAFRREMRRVVPDKDKDFEPLPTTHPIFTKPYFEDIRDVPPGINFYREPVYALKIYDEIAILYTANDYGDMWQFGVDEKGEIDIRTDERGNYVALNAAMYERRNSYYRNITAPALFATYKFGTNVVVHLLTRWEDKVRNVPRSL